MRTSIVRYLLSFVGDLGDCPLSGCCAPGYNACSNSTRLHRRFQLGMHRQVRTGHGVRSAWSERCSPCAVDPAAEREISCATDDQAGEKAQIDGIEMP